MFKPFAIIPIVAAVVLAQTPSSLIPSGISQDCASFLKDLDTNTDITACTTAVIKATASFGGSAKNVTATQAKSALDALCASPVDTVCPVSMFSGQLSTFYAKCGSELTANPNVDVVRTYDVFYTLKPFRDAICSMDDSGNYCSTQAKLPPNTNAADLQNVLSSPSPANSAALIPNTDTFKTNSIPFLFLQTSMTTDSCTVCTRKIVNAYTSFEGQVPYGPGIAKSPLLSGQPELYSSIEKTCGASFLDTTGVVQAAGGLSGGTLGNGAPHANGVASAFVATGMGVLAILISSLS